MTTKTSDKAVLAAIGDVPITASEIARQVGIHRSNVSPRLKRLEKAGHIKSVNGRWVRTDCNKSTTPLVQSDIELCEQLIGLTDEDSRGYENIDLEDESIEGVDMLMYNLTYINGSELLYKYHQISSIINDRRVGVKNSLWDLDDILDEIREMATDEPKTIPETKMTPKQIEFAESLFEVGGDFEIDDERIDIGSTLLVEDILTNLRDIYPQNKSLDILRAISSYCDEYDAEDDVASVDTLLSDLRKIITGETQQKPIVPGTRLNEAQLAFAEKLINNGYVDEELYQIDPTDTAEEIVLQLTDNLHLMYPDYEFLDHLDTLAVFKTIGFDSKIQGEVNELNAALTRIREMITGETSKSQPE
jgi:DNA-binding Lrp family transcriptional regulator